MQHSFKYPRRTYFPLSLYSHLFISFFFLSFSLTLFTSLYLFLFPLFLSNTVLISLFISFSSISLPYTIRISLFIYLFSFSLSRYLSLFKSSLCNPLPFLFLPLVSASSHLTKCMYNYELAKTIRKSVFNCGYRHYLRTNYNAIHFCFVYFYELLLTYRTSQKIIHVINFNEITSKLKSHPIYCHTSTHNLIFG